MSSRIKDLVTQLSPEDIEPLLAELFFALDANSEAAAVKLLWKDAISSEVVEDDAIDYLALTPKGFNTSFATDTRNGVVKKANEAAVNAQTSSSVLLCSSQPAMQTQWKKDLLIGNAVVNSYYANAPDWANVKTLSLTVTWAGDLVQIVPVEILIVSKPADKEFIAIYFSAIASVNDAAISSATKEKLAGNNTWTEVGSTGVFIGFIDLTRIGIMALTGSRSNVKLSATINCVMV